MIETITNFIKENLLSHLEGGSFWTFIPFVLIALALIPIAYVYQKKEKQIKAFSK